MHSTNIKDSPTFYALILELPVKIIGIIACVLSMSFLMLGKFMVCSAGCCLWCTNWKILLIFTSFGFASVEMEKSFISLFNSIPLEVTYSEPKKPFIVLKVQKENCTLWWSPQYCRNCRTDQSFIWAWDPSVKHFGYTITWIEIHVHHNDTTLYLRC